MNHVKKATYFVVALLACFQVWTMVQAQNAPATLDQQFSELFGFKAKSTIIAFTATWCGPCQMHKINLATLKAQGYRVKLYDVDRYPQLFTYFHGRTIPLTCFWKDQTIQQTFVGVTSWRTIKSYLTDDYKIKSVETKKANETLVPTTSSQTRLTREEGCW